MTTRSRSIFSGQGLRTGRLRVKERTLWVFAAAAAAASSSSLANVASSSSSIPTARSAVPCARSAARTVRVSASQCAARDAQSALVVGQHGLRVGGFSLPVGSIRDSHIAFSLQRLTLGQQRHIGAGKIRGKINRLRSHASIESHFIVFSIIKCYQTRLWRHVSQDFASLSQTGCNSAVQEILSLLRHQLSAR